MTAREKRAKPAENKISRGKVGFSVTLQFKKVLQLASTEGKALWPKDAQNQTERVKTVLHIILKQNYKIKKL